MNMFRYAREFTVVAAFILLFGESVAQAKVRAGDEALLLAVTSGIAQKQAAFQTMRLQLVEEATFDGKVMTRTVWSVAIDGAKTAGDRTRLSYDDAGNAVNEHGRSIHTPDFFLTAGGPALDRLTGGSWYELQSGVGSSRIPGYVAMFGPPNPLARVSRLGGVVFPDPNHLLFGDSTVWQASEIEESGGLVLLQRAAPGRPVFEEFVVDTERGFHVIDYKQFRPDGKVHLAQSAELAQFDDAWFPSLVTTDYGDGRIATLRTTAARIGGQVDPKEFELASLRYLNGGTLRQHFLSGRVTALKWVEGTPMELNLANRLMMEAAKAQ